jgi:hypothetical protein
MEDRRTFTIPPGYEAVRDEEGRATGELRLIDSTSDERTVNNVMRHEYSILTETEKSEMKAVKDTGLEFFELLQSMDAPHRGRELALAKTRIEEAVMWAVKAITK